MAYRDQILPVVAGGTGLATFTAGALVGKGTSNFSSIEFAGTANQIAIAHPTGVGGNPTYSLTSNIYVSGISFDTGDDVINTYKSGTFTPTVTAATAPTVGYAAQVGFYQTINYYVYINAKIVLNSLSGGSGDIRLLIPVTVGGTNNGISSSLIVNNLSYSTNTYVQGDFDTGNTYANIRGCKSGSPIAGIQISAMTSSTSFNYSVVYYTGT